MRARKHHAGHKKYRNQRPVRARNCLIPHFMFSLVLTPVHSSDVSNFGWLYLEGSQPHSSQTLDFTGNGSPSTCRTPDFERLRTSAFASRSSQTDRLCISFLNFPRAFEVPEACLADEAQLFADPVNSVFVLFACAYLRHQFLTMAIGNKPAQLRRRWKSSSTLICSPS